ncbi:MAG: glycerol-3-phosphate dehydrogenase/oxidase [Candidatus Dormibacteraeota bacterium]|nr:glycerol-3-phosphate dehydrogenase/oxidase [Candidatus Dormibacteraeota bacterium]MBV9525124.1 glycerol-3-phosphate dehydrogenase/oxidase [Candidatus Dormibacteraeota bacterium]
MTGASASLNAARRTADMARLADGEKVDVVVIGGGITGAGVALDAASRGLRVALVERRDLANGTSRWSSKLAHGGLRYLRQGEFGVAWESARERHILMTRTAPHLVRALPFVAPLNGAMAPLHGALTEMGIRAGDAMRIAAGTRGAVLPRPRRISRHEAVRLVPALKPDDLRGAILFWDGQIEDDARLVIAVARTAAAHGAMVLTYCEALRAERGLVRVRDVVGGDSFDIATDHVVNAAGVWAGQLTPRVHLTPSKGTHAILPAATLGGPRAALVVPIPNASARWVGATPTDEGRVIVGVTDDPYDGAIVDEPRAAKGEVDALLEVLSLALRAPVGDDAVVGQFAGFRPLLAGKSGATADLSRRHAIVADADSGVITVVGGKLTTYRHMAQETVDRLVDTRARPCVTARAALMGAAPHALLRRVPAPQRLVRRYGDEAPAVAAMAGGDASLLQPVAPGLAPLGVELLFGLRHEGALTVADLLDRRVRLGLVPAERRAAEAMAAALVQTAAA